MTRLQVAAALFLSLILAAAAQAAGRSADDAPQWPDVPDSALPAPNPRPAFLDPDETINRIMRPKPGDLDAGASIAADGPQWPDIPNDKMPASKPSMAEATASNAPAPIANSSAAGAARAEYIAPAAVSTEPPASDRAGNAWYRPDALVSSFAFETGARYWFSSARISFAFANGDPLFGNPTSTLDWHGLTAHSGEIFARIDHHPTGAFVKGMLGAGGVFNGQIDDRDFLAGQLKFSDTTSQVKSGNLTYAMLDLGWAYVPIRGVRLSFFAGYHYWREKATASGVLCNQTSFVIGSCPFPGTIPVDFNIAALVYEPVWHVVRLGTEGRFTINDRWSFSSEIALVPFAAQRNDDSHLLRTDLGPVPNIVTAGRYAYGVEAEAFFNYAVTPNIEIGAGARYWGLNTQQGNVRFGPTFATKDELNHFTQERYGLLLQLKGRF